MASTLPRYLVGLFRDGGRGRVRRAPWRGWMLLAPVLVVLLGATAWGQRQEGETIVFTHPPDGGPPWPVEDIYSMSGDGTHLKALTNDGHRHDPAWSPDGKTFAISGATYLLANLRRTGGEPSPDGKKLAFSVEQPRGQWAVHTANAEIERLPVDRSDPRRWIAGLVARREADRVRRVRRCAWARADFRDERGCLRAAPNHVGSGLVMHAFVVGAGWEAAGVFLPNGLGPLWRSLLHGHYASGVSASNCRRFAGRSTCAAGAAWDKRWHISGV